MSASPPHRLRAPAIAFDCGETLWHFVHWPPIGVRAWKPVLRVVADAGGVGDSADIDAAAEHASEFEEHARAGLDEINAQDAIGAMLHALGGDASRDVGTVVEAVADFFRQDLELYPDALATLSELKRRGFRVGALTNVPYGTPRSAVQTDLERTGLAPYIDALVTSADVGVRKPHPAPYEWLAAGLDVEPSEMIYVGNADTDVGGAVAVGAIPIFVDRHHTQAHHGQAATVRSLIEILDLVERGSPADA